MITFLKEWINQIIVAIIIATILEIIIPDSSNKKYIKMIIGIYVLFTIIEPITTKVFGKSIDISSFNYSKYFEDTSINSSSSVASTQNFEENNSKIIEETYIETIKNDIISKLKEKGFETENCDIKIINDENNEKYGTIKNLNLKISKLDNENKIENNVISVNEINIKNSSNENIKTDTISKEDIKELKEYLVSEYSINIKDITIN